MTICIFSVPLYVSDVCITKKWHFSTQSVIQMIINFLSRLFSWISAKTEIFQMYCSVLDLRNRKESKGRPLRRSPRELERISNSGIPHIGSGDTPETPGTMCIYKIELSKTPSFLNAHLRCALSAIICRDRRPRLSAIHKQSIVPFS